MSRYNHRIFPVFFFSKTVICYLLFVTQKIHLWKLSTVNCNAKNRFWKLLYCYIVTLGVNWRCPRKQEQSSRNLFFLSENCNTVSCKAWNAKMKSEVWSLREWFFSSTSLVNSLYSTGSCSKIYVFILIFYSITSSFFRNWNSPKKT